jgi:cold shock CspA family protein
VTGQDKDIFCHLSDVSGTLALDQEVSFDLGSDRDGRAKATNVRVVE